MPLSLERIDAGLTAAFDEFLAAYEKEGGHLYPGFLGPDNPRSYKGPLFWAEGDCQWRLALALERQFPNMVHLEVPLALYTRRDFIKKKDVSQFIDIVVSDLSDFDHERDDFADRPFDVFVEVKFVGHGTSYKRVGERTISEGVKKDLERLKRHLDRRPRPWCRAAAMLVVDDASHVEGLPGQDLPWSPSIRPLLANPTQLKRRKWAKELGVTLPLSCPTCGSPRVAPILRGHPTIEREQAAQRNELILGDDNMFGDDLDPPFGCLDCARKRGLTQPATHPPSNTARVVRAHAADGGQRMSDASADFEPPADYFDENGRLKPDSPPSRAARIVYGPGTIEEQTAKLNALIAQYPDDPGVSCYLEMLANEASGDEITLPFD